MSDSAEIRLIKQLTLAAVTEAGVVFSRLLSRDELEAARADLLARFAESFDKGVTEATQRGATVTPFRQRPRAAGPRGGAS